MLLHRSSCAWWVGFPTVHYYFKPTTAQGACAQASLLVCGWLKQRREEDIALLVLGTLLMKEVAKHINTGHVPDDYLLGQFLILPPEPNL